VVEHAHEVVANASRLGGLESSTIRNPSRR
jgi:hypothetical protein